jgi:glycosyltransferase involved in cell wall biosynthesis
MSLCSQSYPKNKYHCYFVNDASTDKTGEILDNFLGEKSITIIHHEENKGLSAVRNNGIIQGNSELIALLDGDMTVENNWIESFLPYFSKNTIAVMGDNIPPSNVELNPMEKYYFGKNRGARQFNDGDKISFQYMLYGNAMIRRPSLIECGMFDENIIKYGGEDTDLSAKIWDKSPNSFIFSKNSTAVHFHRRTLKEFCLSMHIYGKYNFPVLMKRYPHYEKELGTDWVYSIKGYLLFNPILYMIIKSIYFVIPLQIFIRYMVIYSVVTGARGSK